ncbi:phosphotransferase [Nonomuraea sp. NPDC005650]|uniref:phosphotransferase n=1 Tax=Nonomuraea sp. NPDC005650 TaxID=3157045 RepID=UPI0033BBCDBB
MTPTVSDAPPGDERLVRSLLREQHPDLAELDLRRAVTGWANELWRLGDELAVRLPRRAGASPGLRNEQRWLPALAPRLPLPVPAPVRTGEPSSSFPWPWTVATWVHGEPGDRAAISRGHRAADSLAGFLRALHLPAPTDAPANPARARVGRPARRLPHRHRPGLGTGPPRRPAHMGTCGPDGTRSGSDVLRPPLSARVETRPRPAQLSV